MRRRSLSLFALGLTLAAGRAFAENAPAGKSIHELQNEAIAEKRSPVGHWGPESDLYISWSTHSNRLIPVYTFGTKGAGAGIDLDSYTGTNSAYRDPAKLRRIYGFVPPHTVSDKADYLDQTDIYRIQRAALVAGKKRIILVVFDGTDWVTTRAAAIAKTGGVGYDSGRGTGLHFQDYTAGGTTQFGSMVTSPHNDGTKADVDTQQVKNPGGRLRGGYSIDRGGPTPWQASADLLYPIGKSEDEAYRHAYTDSSASATSMTTGEKTYNDSVNVDPTGVPLQTIAHQAQNNGYAVGVVTSVPISHATPACAYAQNVWRDDYQDLTRDLLGRPSISRGYPLSGVDVLIGGGYGVNKKEDDDQGKNFVPGNRYLPKEDLKAIDAKTGGRYVVVTRQKAVDGGQSLLAAAERAATSGKRLFGFFGVGKAEVYQGNLPMRAAAGDYRPAAGKGGQENYSPADIAENPTLSEMATAALTVLDKNPTGFWMMVEAGDVDWGNHDNNLDAAIGALLSGDEMIATLTDWVEAHGGWDDTVMIVTADHGHYFTFDNPAALAKGKPAPAHARREISASIGAKGD